MNNASNSVSLITVNFNQAEATVELLKSLEEHGYLEQMEVIVVDNNSKVSPKEQINEIYPSVKVIESDVNLGFAGGNNLGIQHATMPYLLFINNDTEVTENFLEPLVEKLQDPGIGLVSPKIKYWNTNIIQYAGFTQIHPVTGRNRLIGEKEEDQGQFDSGRKTAYAHGAAMIMRTADLAKVDPMPEDYFLYYEEMDWCERFKRAGLDIYYEPRSVIYHKESLSTGQLSNLKHFYLTRNRILFMKRNFKGIRFIVFILYFSTVVFIKNILQGVAKLQWSKISTFYKGVLSSFGFKFNRAY